MTDETTTRSDRAADVADFAATDTADQEAMAGLAGGGKLTILQIITPRRYSGAERAMTYLSESLVKRGHRVVVACKYNELLLQELDERGVEAHVLPIRGKLNVAAPFVISRFARRVGADIIHTHLSTASLWGSLGAKLAGVPCVGDVQWLNHKYWYLFADRLTACSHGVRKHLIGQGLVGERIEVVYNGLDPAQFCGPGDGRAVREELGLSPEQPVIGTIAHFSPRKGHVYLLGAMAQLVKRFDDICCLLIGEGRDEQRLRRAVGELGLEKHVRFLGYRHDACELIKAMDVMVLPSLVEGLGIVLIEAGFLGKPAVASDIDGIDEVIVDGETGMLVPPADVDALAVGIEALLDDGEWARQLGRQARSRMERIFSLDAMTDRTEAVYHEVIAEYRGRRGHEGKSETEGSR